MIQAIALFTFRVDGAILYDDPLQLGKLHVKHRSVDTITNSIRSDISVQGFQIQASLVALMLRMLDKDPETRIGLEDVKKDSWFDAADWDAVRSRSLQPP